MHSKMLAGALGAAIFALGAAGSAQAVTFDVNNNNDSGGYSLRNAIKSANKSNAANVRIEFHIPGSGVHTITPLTPLPAITRSVEIDGYTQRDAVPADDTTPATLKAVINAGNVDEGLAIESDDVTVRGLTIQNALKQGVTIEGSGNTIAGNHIGTDDTGLAPEPNDLEGVRVFRGDGNLIGGATPADRNVISSNGFAEVFVDDDSSGNTVQGNYIGSDAAGTGALGDNNGIQLASSGNTVRDNLVSGEITGTGILLTGDDNVVQGNKVGTNADGTAALANFVGVAVFKGDGNQIGGTAEGQGNLVSGNETDGVQVRPTGLDPAEETEIEGNQIGTTALGDAALPNGEAGVSVSGSDNTTVGGTVAEAGNVISANTGDGVNLDDADDNDVLGNWIGTDRSGALDLGNGGSGVEIAGGSNRVGHASAGAANTIAFNHDDGVTVLAGGRNAVLTNSIHDDRGLAIRLDGAAGNDSDDLDTGPNGLQNGPEIDSTDGTHVVWSLDSAQTTQYRIEFFANDTCSVSRMSEAQTYVKSIDVTTDANGEINSRSTALTLPAGAGPFVTMTATELGAGAGSPPLATSEVSPCQRL